MEKPRHLNTTCPGRSRRMVELPHVLVGAAIAAKTGNPGLALPLAFASHFILDLVPHANPSIYTPIKEGRPIARRIKQLIFIDCVLALVVGLGVATSFLPNTEKAIFVVLGAFLAVLPDVAEIPYYFMNFRHPLMVKYVEASHALQNNAPLIPGTITQIIVSLTALLWIFS